jgi:hypothetical protein
MIIARQSTARTVTVGPVLDADGAAVTDGVVADLKIAKNGGAPAALNGSATLTHRHTGYYSLALTASDLDTVGTAEVTMDDTVNAMPIKEVTVLEEAVYDVWYPPSATGAVLLQATQTGVTIPTVTTLTNAPSDSSGVTTLLSRVPSGIFTGITSLAQWLGLIAGKQTGNSTARTEIRATGAGSGTFDETTDSQEAVRDRGDAAWTTATGFSTHSASDVWAVGTRVLTAATNISGPIADQVWEEAIADHSGTAGSTAEALNAAGSAGDPWTTALPGAYTSGQAGKIIGDNINATISSRATPAQVATELGTYDAPTKAELDSAVALLATAANLATLTTTVGVAGAGLTEAGGTGDHLTAINLPDQTMNITGDITGSLSGSVGSVTGAVGSVTGAVGSVTGAVGSVTGAVGSVTGNVGGNVTGSVGSLAAQAKADVNAEVVDALSTDTYAEPAAVPAATATLAAKVGWLAALARNKVTQTATEQTVLADDGTTQVATATVSDDGTTYTRGEFT